MILRHGSLFSGIGGFDLAAELMGWENVFHCEWNEFGKKVLQYYWPKASSYNDIKKTDFRKYRGCIDILTGGFPCQPFSGAGKRKGASDDRYMWPDTLRVVQEVRPSWCVFENVNGLTTMGFEGEPVEVGGQANLFEEDDTIYERVDRGILGSICEDLEREGYSVQVFVIPAEAVEAPHRRDRLWIVAYSQHNGLHGSKGGGGDGETSSRPSKGEDSTFKPKGVHEPEKLGGLHVTDSNNKERIRRGGTSEREWEEGEQRGNGVFGSASRSSEKRDASNSSSSELQRSKLKRGVGEEGEAQGEGRQPFRPVRGQWRDFPTQPPIRGRNDGLPRELDGITFSKWRTESIKAYGNAIVPQVAFEIFKAIDSQETV